MHPTAMELGAKFFGTYAKDRRGSKIVDIGSQDVNGSLRAVAPPGNEYIGIDFVEGKGVDVIINDPYSLPFQSSAVDIVVCSSCFEHSEFFWLLFTEILRILKPNGLLYLNVPSNGNVHRYPVDCWRFYPDSGLALQNWAQRNGFKTVLLESFTSLQKHDQWNDFVAIFIKEEDFVDQYRQRVIATYRDYTNGITYESNAFANPAVDQEDQRLNLKKRAISLVRSEYSRFPKPIKSFISAVTGRGARSLDQKRARKR